jgi:hypothetical protein
MIKDTEAEDCGKFLVDFNMARCGNQKKDKLMEKTVELYI